VRDRLNIV